VLPAQLLGVGVTQTRVGAKQERILRPGGALGVVSRSEGLRPPLPAALAGGSGKAVAR
jgi:hypothetical protein